MKKLVGKLGYEHFAVVDQPEVTDDFIYRQPVVALASRYPISEVAEIKVNKDLLSALGLSKDFTFSRKIVRATASIPHLGNCDCYVVHFKSKRSMITAQTINDDQLPEEHLINQLKVQIAGGWGSTIQRGSEATLLMMEIIARRNQTDQPMVLMGDFNNNLTDGVLSHLLITSPHATNTTNTTKDPHNAPLLSKYTLYDAWDLYLKAKSNESDGIVDIASEVRPATHYYGRGSSVLDHILLSSEFDASHQSSLYQVTAYNTCDRHLINPSFDRDDSSTDHAVVMVTSTLRS